MNKRLISLLLAFILTISAVAVGVPDVAAKTEMKASDEVIDLIKYFEGFSSIPYKDYGQYSIGYGTACDPAEYPNGITEEEADKLLRAAVEEFESKLNGFTLKNRLTLTQNQFDALLSFTYNLGPNWMNNESTFRSAVLNGAKGNDFIFAITMWCTAGADGEKQILSSLVRRRLIEANVYLNGKYTTSVPNNFDYVIFNQNIEEPSNIVRIQGYDSSVTDSIRANPSKTGYRFLGWYTTATGGEWVTVLNESTGGRTLYGHWQLGDGDGKGVSANYQRVTTEKVSVFDSKTGKEITQIKKGVTITITADYVDANGVKYGLVDGGWVDLRKTKAVGNPSFEGLPEGDDFSGEDESPTEISVTVTVTADDVNVRQGPGTNYKKISKANKGDKLHITKVQQGTNYLWGQFSGGWICLDYTDYDQVIAEGKEDVIATGVVVKTDKLNIRNRPGTDGTKVIGTYAEGDVITITQKTKIGSTEWGKTPKGWVSLYYVEIISEGPGNTEDSGSNDEAEQPDNSGDTGSNDNAGGDNDNSGTTGGTADKPEDSGSDAKPTEKVIATGVVVDCTRLRIRKGPGTSYAEVGALAAGTPVEIYEQVAHGSQIWGRIDRGWICMDYVELDVEVSDEEGTVNGVVYNCDQLNVRKGPGTSYSKVAKIPAGTKVQIFETTMVKGVKWGRISLGWISMDYIKLVEAGKPEEEKPEAEKPDTNKPETEKPETEKPDSGSTGGNTNTAMTGTIVKTTELRIRAGAGTNYEVVGKLKKGDRVVILATAKVGNATWGRIEQGWIHLYYVELDAAAVPGGTVTRTVTTNGLNIRAGAGTNYDKLGTYNKGDVVMIYEQTVVSGRPWGRTDRGWICLEYVK